MQRKVKQGKVKGDILTAHDTRANVWIYHFEKYTP